MSSQYRKIKYESEGPHGSTEEHWLYIWSHDTCDVMHVYDEYGDELFSYTETGFDMGQALAVVFTNWKDERMLSVRYNEFKDILDKRKT